MCRSAIRFRASFIRLVGHLYRHSANQAFDEVALRRGALNVAAWAILAFDHTPPSSPACELTIDAGRRSSHLIWLGNWTVAPNGRGGSMPAVWTRFSMLGVPV